MIQSFKCSDTRALFETGKSKQFAAVKAAAERKLQMLDSATTLDFFMITAGEQA